ncbi:hypothetical protein [Streptomyces zingiberis]|uniref:Pectate lyase superfamily protein domain-containing protein n=1 Tax=Streptomyces zingiberis TaxID=2053010 RepID=A0ABX1BZ23_9ACTN|nr:hypothetical protein [Streptomyces zingiberis]NJQ00579.1 hypothetical protein [Streptomyces zingiberis]
MPVYVPTADEFNALSARVTAVERPWEIVVTEGFNSDAVDAAMARALGDRRGTAAKYTVILPPGEYHLTRPLIPASTTGQLDGLSIRGYGKRTTFVNWDASGGTLISAIKLLRFFTISGMTVASTNAANSFAYLWSTTPGTYNEGWTVSDMEFQGPWVRVFGLDGDATANLNSEFIFDNVYTATNSVFSDAFFRSGGISGTYNAQNQFVNYWVRDCCLTLSSGTVFRFDRGGSIRVSRGSWSAASGSSGPITWFSMPLTNPNNRAATQLSVRGVRFEPKAANHLVIDCNWASGSVTFADCSDLASAQNDAARSWNLHRYSGADFWGIGGSMPTVRYRQHQGVGYHLYSGPAVTRGNITYDGCYFWRGTSGQATTATEALRWTSGAPRYRFTDCDNVPNATNIP